MRVKTDRVQIIIYNNSKSSMYIMSFRYFQVVEVLLASLLLAEEKTLEHMSSFLCFYFFSFFKP